MRFTTVPTALLETLSRNDLCKSSSATSDPALSNARPNWELDDIKCRSFLKAPPVTHRLSEQTSQLRAACWQRACHWPISWACPQPSEPQGGKWVCQTSQQRQFEEVPGFAWFQNCLYGTSSQSILKRFLPLQSQNSITIWDSNLLPASNFILHSSAIVSTAAEKGKLTLHAMNWHWNLSNQRHLQNQTSCVWTVPAWHSARPAAWGCLQRKIWHRCSWKPLESPVKLLVSPSSWKRSRTASVSSPAPWSGEVGDHHSGRK